MPGAAGNISSSTTVRKNVSPQTRPNILCKRVATASTPFDSTNSSCTPNTHQENTSQKYWSLSGIDSGPDVEFLGTLESAKKQTVTETAAMVRNILSQSTSSQSSVQTSHISSQNPPPSRTCTGLASSGNNPSVTTGSNTSPSPNLATLLATSENEHGTHSVSAYTDLLREYMDTTVSSLIRNSLPSTNQTVDWTEKSKSADQSRTETPPSVQLSQKPVDQANSVKNSGATKKKSDSFLKWQQHIHGVIRDLVHKNPVSAGLQKSSGSVTTSQQPVVTISSVAATSCVCASATTTTTATATTCTIRQDSNAVVSGAVAGGNETPQTDRLNSVKISNPIVR